jgi:hypothetical protein
MRYIATILALMWSAAAFGQGAVLQGGSRTSGHVPMYIQGGSNSQTIVQDSGPAGGGAVGLGLSELLMVKRGSGSGPYIGGGTGPLGTTNCMYDAPTTNSAGYHYLCFDPNIQSAGAIVYGAGGAAPAVPLNFIVNGITYPFPPAASTGVPVLSGDTTYYFRTDGSDGNSCLGNSAAAACATVQGVLNKAFSVDLNGYNATLVAGNTGTFNGCATISSPQIGRGTITLVGSVSSPASYILAGTDCGATFPNGGGAVVRVSNGANLTVKGFKFQTTTTGWGLYAYAAQLVVSNVDFGSVAEGHIGVEANGTILIGDHTISGGGVLHFHAFNGGSMIGTTGGVATLTGTPAFSAYFAGASEGGLLRFGSYSFAGTGATGPRFLCHIGCIMNVTGDSLTFFPGDQAGTYDQNGFYGSRTGMNNATIKNDDITSLNIYSNSTTTYPAWAMGRNGTQELIAAVATAGSIFFTGTSPGDSVLFSLGHDIWLGKAASTPGIHITGSDTQFPQGKVKIINADNVTGLNVFSSSAASYPAWAMGRNSVEELFGAVATAGTPFFTGTSPGDGVFFTLGHDMWLGQAASTPGVHITATDTQFPQGSVKILNADNVTGMNIYSSSAANYPAWAMGRNNTQELFGAVATAGTPFFAGTSAGDGVIFSLGHDLWLGKATSVPGIHVGAVNTQFPQGVAIVAPQTFAALAAANACAAGTKGAIAVVTDSNTAVWGANIAGGGANVVQAFCNGSNYTVTGK